MNPGIINLTTITFIKRLKYIENMDPETKGALEVLLSAGMLTLAKGYVDFFFGADSPFARYIARPLYNFVTSGEFEGGQLKTEEQYQQYLKETREIIANETAPDLYGRPWIARIATFPFSPKYNKYKNSST